MGIIVQVVVLLHTMLNSIPRAAEGPLKGEAPVRTALVVAPVNTLHNWSKELQRWMGLIPEGHSAQVRIPYILMYYILIT